MTYLTCLCVCDKLERVLKSVSTQIARRFDETSVRVRVCGALDGETNEWKNLAPSIIEQT